MRTEVWYPLAGLAGLAWLVLGLQTALNLSFLKQGVEWVNWLFGILAGLLSLAAGFYATRDTWIEGAFKWVVGLHPVIVLVVGLGTVWATWKLALKGVPDKWAGSTLTVGSIGVAFFLPMAVKDALPPGDVPQLMADGVNAITNFAVERTSGWFS